jgi:hypothetical protein
VSRPEQDLAPVTVTMAGAAGVYITPDGVRDLQAAQLSDTRPEDSDG